MLSDICLTNIREKTLNSSHPTNIDISTWKIFHMGSFWHGGAGDLVWRTLFAIAPFKLCVCQDEVPAPPPHSEAAEMLLRAEDWIALSMPHARTKYKQ